MVDEAHCLIQVNLYVKHIAFYIYLCFYSNFDVQEKRRTVLVYDVVTVFNPDLITYDYN